MSGARYCWACKLKSYGDDCHKCGMLLPSEMCSSALVDALKEWRYYERAHAADVLRAVHPNHAAENQEKMDRALHRVRVLIDNEL